MRADAQRNADKLRTAAAELFQERGLQVPLKEIARRAGVSHGTLYNLFGSREALIDEAITDLAADRLDEVARTALACEDAWEGFAYYVEGLCELQTVDPAVADVLSGRYPRAERLMSVCGKSLDDAERIIERAHACGALRPDFTSADLALTVAPHARLARASAETAPDAWRRGIAFLLDGLRSEAARRPVDVQPPTRQQVLEALEGLGDAL